MVIVTIRYIININCILPRFSPRADLQGSSTGLGTWFFLPSGDGVERGENLGTPAETGTESSGRAGGAPFCGQFNAKHMGEIWEI